VVAALAILLMIVVILSTIHLGVLIAEEIWKPPKYLIPVQGLLEIFGYFLLVLIGVELLETLKAYVQKNVIHVRVVLEVALIAMARKVIVEEPITFPASPCLVSRRSFWRWALPFTLRDKRKEFRLLHLRVTKDTMECLS